MPPLPHAVPALHTSMFRPYSTLCSLFHMYLPCQCVYPFRFCSFHIPVPPPLPAHWLVVSFAWPFLPSLCCVYTETTLYYYCAMWFVSSVLLPPTVGSPFLRSYHTPCLKQCLLLRTFACVPVAFCLLGIAVSITMPACPIRSHPLPSYIPSFIATLFLPSYQACPTMQFLYLLH